MQCRVVQAFFRESANSSYTNFDIDDRHVPTRTYITADRDSRESLRTRSRSLSHITREKRRSTGPVMDVRYASQLPLMPKLEGALITRSGMGIKPASSHDIGPYISPLPFGTYAYKGFC